MALNFQNKASFGLSVAIAAALVVISAIMMTVYANEGPYGALHSLQNSVRSVFVPFGAAGEAGAGALGSVEGMIADASADEETLSALKHQNAVLVEALSQAEEYRIENERLKDLLSLKDEYEIEGVAARIIGRSQDAWNRTLTLDVGSDDGVAAGLTVVGSGGVVGQVVSVSAGSSVVRLIDDPQSGVAAIIQSTRAEGIVRGSLSGLLYLEDLDLEDDVQIGDIVLTSGLGGSYTKGLLIGTVVRVEQNAGSDSRRIIVSQNADVDSLEEVIVVQSAGESSGSSRSNGFEDGEYEDGAVDSESSDSGDDE